MASTILPSCSPASSRSWAAAISGERETAVDVHAGAPGANEVVRAEEVVARAHRRARARRAASTRSGGAAQAGSGRSSRRRRRPCPPAARTRASAPTSLRRPSRRRRRRPSPVASLTAATTSPSWWLTVTSAPQSRAVASFSSLPDVTIVAHAEGAAELERSGRDAAADAPDQRPLALPDAGARDEHPVGRLVDERERGRRPRTRARRRAGTPAPRRSRSARRACRRSARRRR